VEGNLSQNRPPEGATVTQATINARGFAMPGFREDQLRCGRLALWRFARGAAHRRVAPIEGLSADRTWPRRAAGNVREGPFQRHDDVVAHDGGFHIAAHSLLRQQRQPSFAALRSSGECVIAIPARKLALKVVKVGNSSGRDIDKFTAFGLTPVPAERGSAASRGRVLCQSRMPRDRHEALEGSSKLGSTLRSKMQRPSIIADT
jgi:hypothetical protein